MPKLKSSTDDCLSCLSTELVVALYESHGVLHDLKVPHVLVGGIAACFHGDERTTKDVDYLVDEKDAFDTNTTVVTFKPGVPINISGVRIDYLTMNDFPDVVKIAMVECLEDSRKHPTELHVVPLEVLIFMKLKAGRAKDIAAVVELVKGGHVDVDAVADFMLAADVDLVSKRFVDCVETAEAESDG